MRVARGRAKHPTASGAVQGPWPLPHGWRWEPLGGLGTWSGGGTPSKARLEYWQNGTIAWASPKDIKRLLITNTEDYITDAAVEGSSAKLVPAGSVLCVMRSGILRHTFPVAIAGIALTLNQDMRALTPNNWVASKYLAYYLRFRSRNVLETASKGGTTVNSIEASRLDVQPVPIPPRALQDAIVARIDDLFTEVDEGEAALGRARRDLETWRKSLLKAAVTGELTADWRAANPPRETGADFLARILAARRARWRADPKNAGKRYAEPAGPDTTDLPELPDGWVWAGIEQLTIGRIRNGISVKESLAPTGVKSLRLDALQPDGIDWNRSRYLPITLERARGYALSTGDLLISRANGSPAYVGRCSLVTERCENFVFPDTAIRYPLWGERDFLDWVRFAWSAPSTRKLLLQRTKTTAGILKVSQLDIASVALSLPPLAEAGKIARLIREHSASADQGDLEAQALTRAAVTLRQSILAAAFRGELVS